MIDAIRSYFSQVTNKNRSFVDNWTFIFFFKGLKNAKDGR